MKEYHLSPEMDRIPLVSEPMEDQLVSVIEDEQILNALKHASGCGCLGCQGFSQEVHDFFRGDTTAQKPLADPPKRRHGGGFHPDAFTGA